MKRWQISWSGGHSIVPLWPIHLCRNWLVMLPNFYCIMRWYSILLVLKVDPSIFLITSQLIIYKNSNKLNQQYLPRLIWVCWLWGGIGDSRPTYTVTPNRVNLAWTSIKVFFYKVLNLQSTGPSWCHSIRHDDRKRFQIIKWSRSIWNDKHKYYQLRRSWSLLQGQFFSLRMGL